MATVPIKIVRFVADYQPGFVAGELVDANGQVHTFEDKVPVIALDDLDADSTYPADGVLACEVIERWQADDGRELALIDTEKPFDIDSTDGEYRFVVLAKDVVEDS